MFFGGAKNWGLGEVAYGQAAPQFESYLNFKNMTPLARQRSKQILSGELDCGTAGHGILELLRAREMTMNNSEVFIKYNSSIIQVANNSDVAAWP